MRTHAKDLIKIVSTMENIPLSQPVNFFQIQRAYYPTANYFDHLKTVVFKLKTLYDLGLQKTHHIYLSYYPNPSVLRVMIIFALKKEIIF